MTTPAPAPARRRKAPLRATVTRRQDLTPHLVRVTLGGADLERFSWPGPAGHLKLMLPEPGADDVVLPEPDADGTVAFVPGAMPTMRTYTARSFDEQAHELDIDVAVHGDGPVCEWAQSVQPGDRVAVSVPRSAGFTEDDDADWVLLAGDASALPAIASIVPTLTRPATVFLEIETEHDQLDLGAPVQWLVRGTESTAPVGALLQSAVAAFAPPAGRGQAWVAGEAGIIRAIRASLRDHLESSQMTTRGYWRLGTQNHPDHDYGDAQ